jgi:hypothetical protein
LIEHPKVVECAVVPSPDPIRLAEGIRNSSVWCRAFARDRAVDFSTHPQGAGTFQSHSTNRIFGSAEDHLGKDSSRGAAHREAGNVQSGGRPEFEYREEDFPELE